jgi:competence protein ComEC
MRLTGWVFLMALASLAQSPTFARPAVRFYFIDVGWGNATLILTPSGQTMLIDTGDRETASNVVSVLQRVGVKQIDYLLITHYHSDHNGAVPQIAAKFPIQTIVDHGANVEFGKTDEWWKHRRNDFEPGLARQTDDEHRAYLKVCEQHRHLVVKVGDRVPLAGVDVQVLTAGYKMVAHLKGAGARNPVCTSTGLRPEDDTEDGQSTGSLVSYGEFRLVFLGDLTWDAEQRLFCPLNRVGTADVYLITHHAQSFDRSFSDFYWGLSCCPPAEVYALRPRVAILSMGKDGHPLDAGANPAALNVVHASPGLEDIWQTNYLVGGGEKGHNAPEQFCANLGQNSKAEYIELSAEPDGAFNVTNSRNGYQKSYPAKQ